MSAQELGIQHRLTKPSTPQTNVTNGVSAVVFATGNDARAVEAGAHAYASRTGHYSSLTSWIVTKEGLLAGVIEIPLAVGLIGGATKLHPMA